MSIVHPVGFTLKVEVLWNAWVDITDDVRFLSVQSSQRSRLQNVYTPGSLRMQLDNRTRKYDPLYTSGPYYGDLKPGKEVRVQLDSASAAATYIWYGVTDRFQLDYERSNKDATVDISCLSPLGLAALAVIPGGTTPNFTSSDTMKERCNALASASDAFMNVVNPPVVGTFTAAYTTEWDATTSHRLIDEIAKAADLEQGPVVDSTLAKVAVAHGRHWFKERADSVTSQATIGTGGLPFSNIAVLFDADEIITAVSMTDQDGNAVVAIDTAGVTNYGTRYPSVSYDGLPAAHDEALEGAANTVIALRATEEFRIERLTVKPGSDARWLQYGIELELLDRVTIAYTPTGVGSAISADYFIDGIAHEITPGDWTITYGLQPCNRFDNALPGTLFRISGHPSFSASLVDGSDLVGL